jgi:hemerythrin-like domain-containing protein
MTEKNIELKYRCMHPSCVVNCREGEISVEQGLFEQLSAAYDEEGLFKSPKGVCRMGFSQPFKVLEIKDGTDSVEQQPVSSKEKAEGLEEDPIRILVEEHKGVIKILDEIDRHLRIRDIDALWVATAQLENEVVLHSIKKEEEVLMPLLKDLMPLAEGLIAIVKEDHREMLSLLHAIRKGLAEGDIFDGMALSMNTNLKSHIRKEDNEFFELVDKCLDDDRRKLILEGFREVEKNHKTIEAGDRKAFVTMSEEEKAQKEIFDEQLRAIKDLANVDTSSCCHGEHGEH